MLYQQVQSRWYNSEEGSNYIFISEVNAYVDDDYHTVEGTFHISAQGHISSFCITNPKFRNLGFGTQMLKELIYRSHCLGLKKLSLDVSKNNILAYKVYTNLGFKTVNSRAELCAMKLRITNKLIKKLKSELWIDNNNE